MILRYQNGFLPLIVSVLLFKVFSVPLLLQPSDGTCSFVFCNSNRVQLSVIDCVWKMDVPIAIQVAINLSVYISICCQYYSSNHQLVYLHVNALSILLQYRSNSMFTFQYVVNTTPVTIN